MYVYDNVLKCLGLILLWTLDIVTCMCIALGGRATYCGHSMTGTAIDNRYYMYGLYHQLHVIRMTLLSPTFVFESGHETGYMYMF